ncbi:MAG: hypothetical protein K6T63_01840 [Alicyclobacillus herbarius]|uniref:hypothetical protein n=1 Tax=Alicyclobacillus herbarius TaxID=122960 RepID=UPI00040749EA|nr:hypothetical protein [Alicyclobacillus herbarius]MCL6631348.1 hypothetical protein [Alicyclobacillus herbarius]
MWDLMNGMADGVRHRMMPRRRNGINTMTAMLVGASVGIAAWEAFRRGGQRLMQSGSNVAAEKVAEQVMEQIE